MIVTNSAWLNAIKNVVATGQHQKCRGRGTLEVIGGVMNFDMNFPLVTVVERKVSYRFAAAEALWIISGRNDLFTLAKHAPSYSKYSDDGETLYGAYGPPFKEQLKYVVSALEKDPGTRQAVCTFWRQNPDESLDIPCTIGMQFLIRNRKLHCNVMMRSSDVWLGLPYDIFSFSMITLYVYLHLNVALDDIDLGLGKLKIFAGSQHLYDPNLKMVQAIQEGVVHYREYQAMSIHGLTSPDHLRECLRSISDASRMDYGVKFFEEMSKLPDEKTQDR